VVAKQRCTPLKRKERMNDIPSLSKKKKKKGEVYGARYKTTMEKKYSFLTRT